MVMSLTFSNMISHFHYLDISKTQTSSAHLFQKATANYALGQGMRKLPTPLHIRRIGVCASSNESQREGDKDRPLLRTSSGDKAYYAEELEILTLLKKHVPLTSNLAEELRNKFAEIPEERWDRLFEKILKPEHIPRIWEIAEKRRKDTSADTNSEATMLFHMESKPLSPVVWSGKFSGVTWLARLTGNFKMAFFLGNDGHVYGRIISAKHPRTFDGQLVHIRSAGPNVLVGQAMKLDKVWGEVVLVKDCAAKK